MLHAPGPDEKVDLEIRHYGSKENVYKLYDDDGTSFDYEKGAFQWREISITRNKKGIFIGKISAPEKNKPNTVGNVSFRLMTK